MKKSIVIIIAAVLVLGIGAAVVFLVVLPRMNADQVPYDGSYPVPESEKDEQVLFFYPGDYFIVNINQSNRLVKVAIALAYTSDEKITEQLKVYEPFIRDMIVEHVRLKTEEELLSEDATVVLKRELLSIITTNFKVDYIKGIYITDFVVQ